MPNTKKKKDIGMESPKAFKQGRNDTTIHFPIFFDIFQPGLILVTWHDRMLDCIHPACAMFSKALLYIIYSVPIVACYS